MGRRRKGLWTGKACVREWEQQQQPGARLEVFPCGFLEQDGHRAPLEQGMAGLDSCTQPQPRLGAGRKIPWALPHHYGSAYLPVCRFGRIISPLSRVEYTVGTEQLGCLFTVCTAVEFPLCSKPSSRNWCCSLKEHHQKLVACVSPCTVDWWQTVRKDILPVPPELLAVEQERITGSLELLLIT